MSDRARKAWRPRLAEVVRDNWPEHPEVASILERAVFGDTLERRLAAARDFQDFARRLADEERAASSSRESV